MNSHPDSPGSNYDDPNGAPSAWSAREREALGLWRAVEPPAAFSERLLARAAAEGALPAARPAALRGLAFAAVALLIAGGAWSLRGLLHDGSAGLPAGDDKSYIGVQDAGPVEVRQAFDGQDDAGAPA